MPLEIGSNSRPTSPAAQDELSNKRDKNYRRYATTVERALSLFDTTLQEWADYISFLGRLLKALQSKPNGVLDIPHSALVAKRLAQCLDPKLPSGVHQKALEVYGFVFSVLQRDGLSRDLTLYLPGLSPTLSFASLSVRPALLSLFEDFIVQLDGNVLQPALKSIILALLPGLEEETSEEFERVHTLLNDFKDAIERGSNNSRNPRDAARNVYFWQSLFLAAITSASRRQGALQYLSRNLPALGQESASPTLSNAGERVNGQGQEDADAAAITSPEPGLLVRCFAAGLNDDQLLVQRGFLDLLVTKLPLSSAVLQDHTKSEDLDLLVSAAATVVTRREMSLNRRLWAWLLGPDMSADTDDNAASAVMSPSITSPKPTHPSDTRDTYFFKFGLEPLTRSLSKMIADPSSNPSSRARPFRICLSLMDRSEIGGLVVPKVFIPIMKSIWQYEKDAPSADTFSEVLRSSHVFFDGVQSRLIWTELCKLIYDSLLKAPLITNSGDAEPLQRNLDLLWFIITKFNVREEEMLTEHLPHACILMLSGLEKITAPTSHPGAQERRDVTRTASKIALRMLDLIPERALNDEASSEAEATDSTQHQGDELTANEIIQSYIQVEQPIHNGLQVASMIRVGRSLFKLTFGLLAQTLQNKETPLELESALSLLVKLIRKAPQYHQIDVRGLLSHSLDLSVNLSAASDENDHFTTLLGLVSTYEFLGNVSAEETWSTDHRVRQIASNLIGLLWRALSPEEPQHAVEATRGLWRIHAISPGAQLVESTICTLMMSSPEALRNRTINVSGASRFAMLWNQTTAKIRSSSDRRSSLATNKRREKRDSSADVDEMDILARPLLLVLDSLSNPSTKLFLYTIGWLQSLASLQIITDFLVDRLQDATFTAGIPSRNNTSKNRQVHDQIKTKQSARDCSYYLQRLSEIIKYCPEQASASLRSKVITNGTALTGRNQNPDEQAIVDEEDEDSRATIRNSLIKICIQTLEVPHDDEKTRTVLDDVSRYAAQLLKRLVQDMLDTTSDRLLEESIIKVLSQSVENSDLLIQGDMMDVLLTLLGSQPSSDSSHTHLTSKRFSTGVPQTERDEAEHAKLVDRSPTPALLDCLILGLSSSNSRPTLDQWISFLGGCLPLYGNQTFQILIPLVECFQKSISEVFERLRASFIVNESRATGNNEPINTINILFNGLEQTLARGHDQMKHDEARVVPIKSPEQSQGFFGNMVSGVFASETQRARSSTANDRLTVLICFKDSVRIAFNLWSWGDTSSSKASIKAGSSASFNYASVRLRNRARRLLENLFATEPLESLETLVEAWSHSGGSPSVLNLLHALDAARPKNTIPTVFNALYSRTSPTALDSSRTSSLTSDLSDSDLAKFLISYTKSIDDDALDEIWTDCMAFAKDVLGNPMPQRQILPRLLEFVAVIGEKIDNTNFGEQRRMRKEIADIFVRLLAATFTVRPVAFAQDPGTSEKSQEDQTSTDGLATKESQEDVVAILASILPHVSTLLVDTDRIVAVCTAVSTQILGPTFRSRRFPFNVTSSTLEILKLLSKIPEVAKIWKKDAAEAFNDPKFFTSSSLVLARNGWMPVLKQWALLDKDRMLDILTRINPPTSAGIMFGVGASSARLEADRKTQMNLRRIAFLLVAADTDDFLVNLDGMEEKLAELANATVSSSPSSTTRAEAFMVLRALVLKVSAVHLSSVWPLLNSELYNTLLSLLEPDSTIPANVTCILQAAKLLDLLLTLAPDDFQLREWLYVTDTIDAIYRTSSWKPTALVDGLADRLDNNATVSTGAQPNSAVALQFQDHQQQQQQQQQRDDGLRRPLLRWDTIQGVPRGQEMIDKVLRPFLRQLSITAFESTYRMETADREACVEELLRDLFDEKTLVS